MQLAQSSVTLKNKCPGVLLLPSGRKTTFGGQHWEYNWEYLMQAVNTVWAKRNRQRSERRWSDWGGEEVRRLNLLLPFLL